MLKFLLWDKVIHFVYTYAIQITLLLVFGVWSLVATPIIATAVEIYDKKVHGTFDITDLLMSVLGGVVAFMIYAL